MGMGRRPPRLDSGMDRSQSVSLPTATAVNRLGAPMMPADAWTEADPCSANTAGSRGALTIYRP